MASLLFNSSTTGSRQVEDIFYEIINWRLVYEGEIYFLKKKIKNLEMLNIHAYSIWINSIPFNRVNSIPPLTVS